MLEICRPAKIAPISRQSSSNKLTSGYRTLNRLHIFRSTSMHVKSSEEGKRRKICSVMGPVPAPNSKTLLVHCRGIFSESARPRAALLGAIEPIVRGDFKNRVSTSYPICLCFLLFITVPND